MCLICDAGIWKKICVGRTLRQAPQLLVTMIVLLVGMVAGQGLMVADEVSRNEVKSEESVLTDEQKKEYFELFKLFADTIDQVERNYVKPIDRRELVEAAIRGLTTKLDPYSNYISPEEIDSFRSGIDSEFGGIGIQVTIERGRLTIISPLAGTPAYRAGLMAGDSIVEIEGESTDGISLDQAVRQMKGKVGTPVTITLQRARTGNKESFTLKRELIRIETVLGDTRDEEDQWNFLYDATEKIGYIRITAFSRHTVRDLRKAFRDLTSQGFQGLVLDLRYNPGGLLSSSVEVSDMFVASGVIVSTEGRNTKKRVWKAVRADTFQGFPMVVLVNEYSASASEIVAACLQDHGRAVIIGTRTWGKGSVQNVVELEDGKSALKLTTASYQRPSGKNIHRFYGATKEDQWGVHPDDGYVVELEGQEEEDYLKYRRTRDIIQGDTQAAPDTENSSEPSPETVEETPVKSEVEGGQEENGNGLQEGSPVEDDSKSDPSPNNSPNNDEVEPVDETSSTPTEFQDRVLLKGLEYLREQMVEFVQK